MSKELEQSLYEASLLALKIVGKEVIETGPFFGLGEYRKTVKCLGEAA